MEKPKIYNYKKFEILSRLVRVELPEIIIHWDDRIKYLIYPDLHSKVFDDKMVETMVDKKFTDHINKLVTSYLLKKAEPPAESASVVMNLADDYLSGRAPVIRAGDYITMQNYLRKGKF
jgi:hypothetical protein